MLHSEQNKGKTVQRIIIMWLYNSHQSLFRKKEQSSILKPPSELLHLVEKIDFSICDGKHCVNLPSKIALFFVNLACTTYYYEECTQILMHEWVHNNILCCLNFKMSIYIFLQRCRNCQQYFKQQQPTAAANFCCCYAKLTTKTRRFQTLPIF